MPLPFDRILKIFARSQERMILFPEEVPEGLVLVSLNDYEKMLNIVPFSASSDSVAGSISLLASVPPTVSAFPSQTTPLAKAAPSASETMVSDGVKAVEDLTEEEMFSQINMTIARWEEAQKNKMSAQIATPVPSEKMLQFREDWIPSQDRVLKEDDLRDVPHQEENFQDV